MSTWARRRKKGLCGRCGTRVPLAKKSRCELCAASVNAARRKWASIHPEKAQASKNAYWKTAKGKAAIQRRQRRMKYSRS